MRFFLDFQSDGYGKKQVDEIFGTSDINFSLKQKDGKLGRDVSFSGNEIQFEFTHLRNHELKQLLYYHRKFGFESVVVLTIEIDSLNKYTCDLDFATAETDDLEYFKCKGIEDGKLQIINARKSVKVDVLSDLDVDGNYIGGLVPENMLLLAKPLVQVSRWEQPVIFYENLKAENEQPITVYYQVNPAQNLAKSELEDTLSFFSSKESKNVNAFDSSNFTLIKFKNASKNVNISIKDLLIHLETDVDNGAEGYVDMNFNIYYGADFSTATKYTFLNVYKTEHQTYDFTGNFFYNIPSLNRGDTVWLQFDFKVRQSHTQIIGNLNQRFECFTTISGMNVEISAESTAYNSVSKSLRLVDVMRQIIRSVSGLSIDAPRFEAFGQFYDNRLLNGNFLRGITDKPFYISLEDIEKSIVEMYGDYEIDSNGKIFFGIYQDFYTNNEVGFFNNTQFSEMNKTYNPKYMINEFGFKYANYQSLKENEEPNSADTIHGESKFVLFNKSVENKKEIEVDWTRDAFLIEETRKKAIIIKDNTASQEDDTIFCLDSIATTFDNEFTEVTELQHSYDASTFKLTLRNDGSINFISLGIIVGSYFYIQTPDANAGTYTVDTVGQNSLELIRALGIVTTAGDGTRQTKYKYTLSQSTVPYTNYTNQGFSETANLSSSDNYSNRRYSIKQNIYNYYQSYLATANLYWKDKPLKNTWYKNNGDYVAKYDGVKLTEKEDFIPENPILSPMLYNEIVFKNVDFVDFIALINAIRSVRGFIRAIDNNDTVFRFYSNEVSYSLLEKELRFKKGEEKYEPSKMTIETKLAGFYLINGQTGVNKVIYSVENEKVYLYDLNRYRLYNGVYWMEISVNGAFAPDLITLKSWLDLLI
jgi:hypothetical protein